MENNSIQMATSAGQAVAYMIAPIFKHIIDCVHQWLHRYCLRLVSVTFIFDGTLQIIVQRCSNSNINSNKECNKTKLLLGIFGFKNLSLL